MEGLISVVIPVYNVEKYVERCVKSVLNQTYGNLEVILVNDGSTDGSGDLCDSIAKTDERILVIHQPNQGLGPARNAGLDIMKGEYVAFVDSDDWIECDAYEVMLSKMLENNCDIAACGRAISTDEKIVKYVYCSEKATVLNREEAVKHFLLQKDMNMSACDKLFKSNLFKDIRFPGDYFISEDIVPIYSVIKKSKRVILTGQPFYNYYYRAGSLSKSRFNKKLMGSLIYSKETAERVRVEFPSLTCEADYFEIDAMIGVYRTLRSSRYKGEERKRVLEDIKSNLFKTFRNRHLYIRQKVYVLLAVLRIDALPNRIYGVYKKMQMK